jgi:hypothetical protein
MHKIGRSGDCEQKRMNDFGVNHLLVHELGPASPPLPQDTAPCGATYLGEKPPHSQPRLPSSPAERLERQDLQVRAAGELAWGWGRGPPAARKAQKEVGKGLGEQLPVKWLRGQC